MYSTRLSWRSSHSDSNLYSKTSSRKPNRPLYPGELFLTTSTLLMRSSIHSRCLKLESIVLWRLRRTWAKLMIGWNDILLRLFWNDSALRAPLSTWLCSVWAQYHIHSSSMIQHMAEYSPREEYDKEIHYRLTSSYCVEKCYPDCVDELNAVAIFRDWEWPFRLHA